MRDPIVLITMAGLAGLIILNPVGLTAALALVRGIITRTLALAGGGGPSTPSGGSTPHGTR